MLHVVGRQFAEHVISQAIHDTLPRLAATAARVLRLNTDNGRQHLVDHVRLITAPRHSHVHTRPLLAVLCSQLQTMTLNYMMKKTVQADDKLFSGTVCSNHCLHHLLQPDRSMFPMSLRPRGHSFDLPMLGSNMT